MSKPTHYELRIAEGEAGLYATEKPNTSGMQYVTAGSYALLLAERDRLKDTLEHIRDTIDGQLTLIAQRAPGKYLDKTPIVRCLRLHRTRADEAIAALQGEQT